MQVTAITEATIECIRSRSGPAGDRDPGGHAEGTRIPAVYRGDHRQGQGRAGLQSPDWDIKIGTMIDPACRPHRQRDRRVRRLLLPSGTNPDDLARFHDIGLPDYLGRTRWKSIPSVHLDRPASASSSRWAIEGPLIKLDARSASAASTAAIPEYFGARSAWTMSLLAVPRAHRLAAA